MIPPSIPCSCWYHAGHGTETLVDGICNSCNPYMIWLGQKMGRHTFFNFFEAFGFTQRTGIDLPGEADSLYFSEDRAQYRLSLQRLRSARTFLSHRFR